MLLAMILLPHLGEVNTVLEVMGITGVDWPAEFVNMAIRMTLTLGLFMGLWFRSIPWIVAMVTLSLTATLPLATAFGIYFVLQHSLSGWNHLKLSHKWTNLEMWMKACHLLSARWSCFCWYLDSIRIQCWRGRAIF